MDMIHLVLGPGSGSVAKPLSTPVAGHRRGRAKNPLTLGGAGDFYRAGVDESVMALTPRAIVEARLRVHPLPEASTQAGLVNRPSPRPAPV